MSQLVPCPQCARHVRLSGSSCPFCDAALDVVALGERYAPRTTAAAVTGVKRAVMFAIGAGMAAACSGDAVPVYGAPVSPTNTTSNDVTGTESSDPALTDESTLGDVTTEVVTTGAVSSSDVGETFTEPGAQPPYGAPVLEETTDAESTAQLDAGVADAGDGGTADENTELGHTSEPRWVPIYGGPPLLPRQ
jgi:hypothetical protein